jgi:hypothetical protein
MLCRMCFQAEATVHVLDRPSSDGLVESHYCPACYALKYVNPPTRWLVVSDDSLPAPPPAFPRPRFTIRDLMIIAGLFAILNASVALFMRSGLVKGTPARIQEWTTWAFLVANPSFAIFLVEIVILSWLRKMHLHKITGGLPVSQLKAICRLAEWRIAWEGASLLERALLILCSLWPFTWFFWFGFLIPRRTFYFLATKCGPMLVVAALPLIVFGVETFLLWGLVASTRRR